MKRSPARTRPNRASDSNSDASFRKRQKKLKALGQDFWATLCSGVSAAHQTPVREDFDDSIPRSDQSVNQIIEEIRAMQTETAEIIALLARPQFADNLRAQSISKQVQYIERMNERLLARVAALRS